MAYNTKFKSIKSVIEDAYRDSNSDTIDYEAAVADAVEMIGLIGIPYAYIEKHTNGIDSPVIEVSNYRAVLPYDLKSLKSMRKVTLDEDNQVIRSEQMIETPDIYHQTPRLNSSGINYVEPTASGVIASLDEDDNLTTEQGEIVGVKAVSYIGVPYKYKVDNNIVFTNFKDGYIDIAYLGYPTDEFGMIMIPDDEKFSHAVKCYIIYKLDYRKWRVFPEKPGLKALLNVSEQNYYAAVSAARNKGHIPTVDQMESLKNQWLRSNYDINAHANGFRTMHDIQRRKF